MGDNSKIEWTSSTWNPIRARNRETGNEGWFCVHVSDGCKNCYAETMNVDRRWGRGTGLAYKAQNLKHHEILLHEKTLLQPLRWSKPRKIFVCSMTDLFGEFVPFEFIDKVFAVMALAPQHTFQVLTKRSERMANYFTQDRPSIIATGLDSCFGGEAVLSVPEKHRQPVIMNLYSHENWPLPNVWLGTSVEDQATADERLPHLLRCPAAVRWLSCEPLLGPVVLCGGCACGQSPLYGGHINPDQTGKPCKLQKLDWIVVGGESGPKARPFRVEWARSIIQQCRAADVAVFVKQMGSYPIIDSRFDRSLSGWSRKLKDRKGGDMHEWPEDLRIREYPTPHQEPTPTP